MAKEDWKRGIYDKEGEDKEGIVVDVVCFSIRHGRKK